MVAITTWLNQDHWMFTITSIAAILIFRGEVVLLMFPIAVGELYSRRLSLKSFVQYSLYAAVMLLGMDTNMLIVIVS